MPQAGDKFRRDQQLDLLFLNIPALSLSLSLSLSLFFFFFFVVGQDNGSDCGVFTCKFADFVSRQKRFVFEQANIPYFRKRLAFEILSEKLLGG